MRFLTLAVVGVAVTVIAVLNSGSEAEASGSLLYQDTLIFMCADEATIYQVVGTEDRFEDWNVPGGLLREAYRLWNGTAAPILMLPFTLLGSDMLEQEILRERVSSLVGPLGIRTSCASYGGVLGYYVLRAGDHEAADELVTDVHATGNGWCTEYGEVIELRV